MIEHRPPAAERYCPHCETVKPAAGFYRDRKRVDGLGFWCRVCTCAYNREYVKRNPEANAARARKSRIKATYGITWEQRDQMIVDQGNQCAICGGEFTDSKTTHVDHCHTTGKVRDILCYSCNSGLGSFKDDPLRLAAALEYLKRHHG